MFQCQLIIFFQQDSIPLPCFHLPVNRIYACSDRKEAGPGSHAIHWKMEAWQRDGILPEKNNKLTLEHFANALRFREGAKEGDVKVPVEPRR